MFLIKVRYIFALILILLLANASYAEIGDIRIEPSALEVRYGMIFTLEVSAEVGDTILGAYHFKIPYDTQHLRVILITNAKEGRFSDSFSSATVKNMRGSTFKNGVINISGTAAITRDFTKPIESLFYITFEAISPSESPITLKINVIKLISFDDDDIKYNSIASQIFITQNQEANLNQIVQCLQMLGKHSDKCPYLDLDADVHVGMKEILYLFKQVISH